MDNPSARKALPGLVGWTVLVFMAAATGALASAGAGAFYEQLTRPPWAPPGWLFGPVWTLLYLSIALSIGLVWRAHGFHGARVAVTLFVLQLVANALWPWLFFVWREGGAAFAWILLLWLLIVATIASFWRLRVRLAASLLLPYLAWVTFAAFLSFSTWRLNPQLLG